MNNLDFHRLSTVCGWLNTLPLYMFQGELTASLMLHAYAALEDGGRLESMDHGVRMVLNYQASLEQPLHHQQFVEILEQVLAGQPPEELVAFLARETTH